LNVINIKIPPLRQRPEDISILTDYFIKKSAMARTTAFPAAAVARYVANGIIKERGVVPPETGIGQNKQVFDMLIEELKEHDITITI